MNEHAILNLTKLEKLQIVFTTSSGIWVVDFVCPKKTHVIVVDVIKTHDEALQALGRGFRKMGLNSESTLIFNAIGES